MKKSFEVRARTNALIGLALSVPIGLLFLAIVFELEPLQIVLRFLLTADGDRPNAIGFIVMYGGFLVLPLAFALSVWPLLQKTREGKRRFFILNFAVAVLVLTLMVPTWGSVVEEVYRCDVAQIPNCD